LSVAASDRTVPKAATVQVPMDLDAVSARNSDPLRGRQTCKIDHDVDGLLARVRARIMGHVGVLE
jgi:hypothetical protein